MTLSIGCCRFNASAAAFDINETPRTRLLFCPQDTDTVGTCSVNTLCCWQTLNVLAINRVTIITTEGITPCSTVLEVDGRYLFYRLSRADGTILCTYYVHNIIAISCCLCNFAKNIFRLATYNKFGVPRELHSQSSVWSSV